MKTVQSIAKGLKSTEEAVQLHKNSIGPKIPDEICSRRLKNWERDMLWRSDMVSYSRKLLPELSSQRCFTGNERIHAFPSEQQEVGVGEIWGDGLKSLSENYEFVPVR